jgi:hypothetical protein
VSVVDRGLFLTCHAIGRQLAAMPCELYLVRLIHHRSRRAFPGERLWTATQLMNLATVRFLRIRNREGCDVYIQPYAEDRNAGYVLVDLDQAAPAVLERMRTNGHEPCVVLQTSPGNLQAWIHVSPTPLDPAVATTVGRELARRYGGDLASTDWRHLGRLAGFTNQKPERRLPGGWPPWAKILAAQPGLATQAGALLEAARQLPAERLRRRTQGGADIGGVAAATHPEVASEAQAIYRAWMKRLRITDRFPQPDWSIVDLWIARELLARDTPAGEVQALLRFGSPNFPRSHGDPEDYLHRTLARAAFPAAPRRGAVWAAHARPSAAARADSARSNSAGGR